MALIIALAKGKVPLLATCIAEAATIPGEQPFAPTNDVFGRTAVRPYKKNRILNMITHQEDR